ncbi:hypothetical protein ACHAWF_018212 [Thalassiosira exigua]
MADPQKLIQQIASHLESHLFFHKGYVRALTSGGGGDGDDGLDCSGALASAPLAPLHSLPDSSETAHRVHSLSRLFRSVACVDWLVRALADALRAASQRPGESTGVALPVGGAGGVSSADERGVRRGGRRGGGDTLGMPKLVYRLRIVCQEGAVVRDGIDIDRHESVGSLEMGEAVLAYGASSCTHVLLGGRPCAPGAFLSRPPPTHARTVSVCLQTDASTPPASSGTARPAARSPSSPAAADPRPSPRSSKSEGRDAENGNLWRTTTPVEEAGPIGRSAA